MLQTTFSAIHIRYITYNNALRAIPLHEFWRVTETPVFRAELLPMRDIVYRIEMAAFGLEPIPYKAVNCLFLLLCGLIVWMLTNDFGRRFGGRQLGAETPRIAATVTLVLWIAHPSHVESVAWAAGLKDVLSGLFGLLTLYTFQKALPATAESKGVRVGPLVGASLFFAAAIASKITVVPVAGMALLLAFAALSRPGPSGAALAKGVLVTLPLLAIAGAAVAGHAMLAEAGTRPALFTAIADGRFERAIRILGTMYQMTVLPYDLRLTWDVFGGGALGILRLVFAALAILGACWGAWVFIARQLPEGFGLAAAFGGTVPVLQLVPFETWSLASERHLFWLSFGLALSTGFVVARLVSRSRRVLAPITLALGVVTGISLGQTLLRSLEWHAGPEQLRVIENEADPSWGFGAILRIEDELRVEQYNVAMRIATRVEDRAQREMLQSLVLLVEAVMEFSRDRNSTAALQLVDRRISETKAALRAVKESVSDPALVWWLYTMQRKLVPPYEGLTRLAPGQGRFWYNLALIKKDDLDPAAQYVGERLFLQAISTKRLSPSIQADSWIHIADIRYRRNDFAGARHALLNAMTADPAGYRAANLLAGLDSSLGNEESAESANRQFRDRAAAAGVEPDVVKEKLGNLGDDPDAIFR